MDVFAGNAKAEPETVLCHKARKEKHRMDCFGNKSGVFSSYKKSTINKSAFGVKSNK